MQYNIYGKQIVTFIKNWLASLYVILKITNANGDYWARNVMPYLDLREYLRDRTDGS